MRQLFRSTGIIMIAAAILFSCAGNPDAGRGDKEKGAEKALTLDQKAKNTLKNLTVIFSGSMIVAMNDVFRSQAQGFAEAFGGELDDEAIAEIDAEIEGLGDDIMQPLEEMMDHANAAFDNMAEENITVYEKMFLHDLMKEGVEITEKYDLPPGFRPLSQDLSKAEIKRYIMKVTSDNQDMDDPIMKTYMELFEWLTRVGPEFEADPEIKAFMENLQGS